MRLIAILVLSLFAFTSVGGEKLRLFIWSEYLPQEVLQQFEREFKCQVVVDLFEEAEAMLAKVQSGGAASYDVVVVPDYLVTAFLKLGLAAPLRAENIPNLQNLEQTFRSPPYDKSNKYTAAYQWGTVGILARKRPGEDLQETWGLFFDPKKQPGAIILIDSMRDLIGAALKYNGYSYNSTDSAQLREARDLLIQSKKRSIGFASSVGARNKVLDGSAQAAIVYSGEGARAMKEDPHTVYFIPKEGGQIWVDNLLILAKAPNRDLAEKFIDFVLDAKIGAAISNYTLFSSPNKASKRFIAPELLQNGAIYPPPEIMSKLEYLEDLGKSTRLYDQIWQYLTKLSLVTRSEFLSLHLWEDPESSCKRLFSPALPATF
jgi:spermidine/putrescine transport system substrate-binding protein